MRLALMGMAVVFLAACAPADREDMTLEKLLKLHTDARGGADALENIKTVSIKIDITEPTFHVTGHYRASRRGWMRIDIYSEGERVFTEALGPDGGWQMNADGTVADLSPKGKAALENGVTGNLFGLHEITARGYALEFIGAAERNGATYWDVEKTAPNGDSQHLFFDKDTFLIVGDIATSALHPDVDSTEVRQETYYSDFRNIGGVIFSNREETRNVDTGEVLQTVITTARELNPELDPAQFVRPKTVATE